VEPAELLRSRQVARPITDRETRGVRRHERGVGDPGLEPEERFALGLGVLHDGFDDDVCVR
jgi:hypothetical protein